MMEMEWMPIETAPRDGTRFLGYWPSSDDYESTDNPAEVRTWWAFGRWENPWENSEMSPPPTHWMPRPLPPEAD